MDDAGRQAIARMTGGNPAPGHRSESGGGSDGGSLWAFSPHDFHFPAT